jgi:hypothetical protein
MDALQRGCMQSELAFVIFQILKLLLRDAFIVTVFAFPLPATVTPLANFTHLINTLNVPISVALALALAAVLVLAICKPDGLQEKFRNVMQTVIPWLDVCAFLIITVSLQLLRVNAREQLWLVGFNVVAVVVASLVACFHSLFNFTKEPRSNSLLKRREARAVAFCDLAGLLLCYYLASAHTPGELPGQLNLIFSFIQVCLSLVKISTLSVI